MEIRLLGPFEVTGIGGMTLGGARPQSVLALLAVNQRRVLSRDQVIEAVWTDPPKSAVSTLHGYVSHLRKALTGTAVGIESCSSGYRYTGPDEAVDVHSFDRLFAAAAGHLRSGEANAPVAAAAVLEEALALWRGPALQGLLDAPFAGPEARRLEQRRVDASMMLAEALMELGRPSDAAERLEPVCAENLFNEESCLLLMRCLSAAGRRVEALAAFRRLRRVLRDELGVDPSPSLQAAELELLGHNETRAAPSAFGKASRGSRRSPWPAYSTSFVGRTGEIGDLSQVLQSQRVVAVVGPGGAGKTRLVLAAVESIGREVAFDRQAFVDLSGWSERDGLWAATSAAVSDINIAPTIDAIATALRGSRALIVLDNCEHMAEACAEMVSELVARTESTSFVLTSREALGIGAETVWTIPPLGTPRPGDSVAASLESDAVRLFMDRCSTRGRDPDEVHLISEIVRHADGVPLAVELAASAATAFTLRDVRDRLRGEAILDEPIPTASGPRHESLAAMIDWSVRLLSDAERTLLSRLGVIQGWFGIEDVESVCCADDLPPNEAFKLLGKLVHASLVVFRPGEKTRPYGLLEMVRAFALNRLRSESAVLDGCQRRHLAHFAHLAAQARAGFMGKDPARWLHTIDQVEPDLVAALETARRLDDHNRMAIIALTLSDHRVARYRLRDAQSVLEAIAGHLPPDHPSRPEVAIGSATAAHLLDEFSEADKHCQEATRVAGRLRDDTAKGFALARLAEVLRSGDNNPEAAAELVTTVEAIAAEHQSVLLRLEVLRLRSALEWDAGEVDTAEATMRTWRREARKAGCARAAAEASLQLSGLLSGRGRYRESDELAQESTLFYGTTGDPLESAYLLYTRARSCLYQQDLDAASAMARQALDAFERIGDEWGAGIALRVLGEARLRAGLLVDAGDHLRRSLDLMRQRGFADDVAASSDPLAQWALAGGDLDQASALVASALDGLGGHASRNRGPLLRTAAVIAARRGDVAGARQLADEALEECRRTGTAASLQAAEDTWSELRALPET